MAQFHNSISRRDFMKSVMFGVGGTAAAAGVAYAWGMQDGTSPLSFPGHQNRRGFEYEVFDRTPFEVDEVPETSWKVTAQNTTYMRPNQVVNGIHRPDLRWIYNSRFKNRHDPDVNKFDFAIPYSAWPSNGVQSLAPFWREYYEMYPDMLERDKKYIYDWLPGFRERYFKTTEMRDNFNAQEGYIANKIVSGDSALAPSSITTKPETFDWQGVSTTRAVFESPEKAAENIKWAAYHFGAQYVGIIPVHPEFVWYNHQSATRGFAVGEEIKIQPWWNYGIFVNAPMEWDSMMADPNYGQSNQGYNIVSTIAQQIVGYLKALGYPARWNSPNGGYDLTIPPHGALAGYGSIGRTSNCMSPDVGGNCRPAVVFTSLPMATDKPIDFNLYAFCKRCMICAENCPTQAISYSPEPDRVEYGMKRYATDFAVCNDGWAYGAGPTGCRACVAACPWTRRNTWSHRMMRNILARDSTGLVSNVALWAERNMYPKNMLDDLNPPLFKGVFDPPEYLKTANFISGFTPTPMGVK
ncbi:4Fe-4S double cluster binding domain-containing protein [Dehalogenimonas sp. 4OHTPN]|uniref:4Fe-4S double cluster binding domain-containing protein n=1 Tax=Dehalogenimonas sp. 4OHTPN TaxID=3166643 RepID=A0AAU8GB32_9CHLR